MGTEWLNEWELRMREYFGFRDNYSLWKPGPQASSLSLQQCNPAYLPGLCCGLIAPSREVGKSGTLGPPSFRSVPVADIWGEGVDEEVSVDSSPAECKHLGRHQRRKPLTEACFLGFRCPVTHSLPFRCQCQHSCLVFGPPKDSLHGVTWSCSQRWARELAKILEWWKNQSKGGVSLNRIGMETFGGWGLGGGTEKSRTGKGKLNQILLCRFSPK